MQSDDPRPVTISHGASVDEVAIGFIVDGETHALASAPDGRALLDAPESAVEFQATQQFVPIERDVLAELVGVARGKLEGDVGRWGPEETGYDVEEFAETIEAAEQALEVDDAE